MTTATDTITSVQDARVQQARVGRALKWRLMSLVMRTGGRLSDGIALGYRRGFDSGEMLDYVYEDRARGRFLIGRLIDRFYLNAVGWRGIRNRRALLSGAIARRVRRNRRRGRPTRIVDVASGPGRYLLDVVRDVDGDDVSVLCRDMDESGLARGRELARSLDVTSVRYERGDAFSRESIASIDPRPNVIVVSGLYELFLDREMILRSLRALSRVAAPDARIFVTTQVSHPQLDMIANVLPNREGVPWIMECRPVELTESWLRRCGFTIVSSHTEPTGLFALTEARKS